MAVLKAKDVVRMDAKTRDARLKELRMELIKANVSANKQSARTKEIKKAIARLITYVRSHPNEGKQSTKEKLVEPKTETKTTK